MPAPKTKLPAYGQPVKTEHVADLLLFLETHLLLDSVFVTGCELDGSGDFAFFRHGLRRPYKGVIIAGQSRTDVFIRVLLPSDAALTEPHTSTTHFGVRPTGLGEAALACAFDALVF